MPAFRRSQVTRFFTARVHHDLLQYHALIGEPVFQHMQARLSDMMFRGFDDDIIRYPFIPNAATCSSPGNIQYLRGFAVDGDTIPQLSRAGKIKGRREIGLNMYRTGIEQVDTV